MKSPLRQILEFISSLALDKTIPLVSIINILREQGAFCLLFFLTLPFLTPLQIPGLSTPFGILMSIIAFRKIFHPKIWIPKFLLNKTISSQELKKILKIAFKIESFFSKFFKPRFNYFFSNSYIKKFNFFVIAISSVILALPLPFSNLFFAWIILFLSLGHLMNDGLAIIFGDSLFIIFSLFVIFSIL